MISRATIAAALLLCATWGETAAAAETEGDVAFTVGARLSVAFPMGSIVSDPSVGSLSVDQLVAVSVPLQLDLGATLHRRWFVGGYVQYAWSFLQIGQCEVGDSCSITGLRLGLQGTYAFRDDGGPWVGLGTGWEWMFTSFSGPGFDTRLDVGGWEYAIFQAGWDVEVASGWRVGPWFSGSIGEFTRAAQSSGGQTTESAIRNRALHGWLQLGVRGNFSL